jgi:uncharacterized protein YneF (UPF0154 family)
MMKKTTWILGIALAGLIGVAGAGCKKAVEAPKVPTYSKVQIDIPKLRQSLAAAGPEVQNVVRKINLGLRYGKYVDSLTALDQLKENPALNDAQKKVVDEVIEQIKEAAKNQEAAKAAAQQQ